MRSFNLLFLFLLFLISCQSPGNYVTPSVTYTSKHDSIETQRIKQLDSLGLVKGFNFNDTAKWLLYLQHYNDTTKWGELKKDFRKIPLSYLPLRLNLFFLKNDTLDLMYMFWYNDTTFVENFSGTRGISRGVRFDVRRRKFIAFWGDEVAIPMLTDSFPNSLITPKFLEFCKDNRINLDPWLQKEIARRGYF
jgi:hypothetical protein